MAKVPGIFAQTPSHDTAQLLRLNNLRELATDDLGRVPGPEDVDLGVEVVVPAGFLVGLAVLLGAAPRVGDRDAMAGAVVGETACLAEVWTGAAGCVNIMCEVREENEYAYQWPYWLQHEPLGHLVLAANPHLPLYEVLMCFGGEAMF